MAHTFVKYVMVPGLATLDSSATIKDAAKEMDEENIGCIIARRICKILSRMEGK